VDTKNEFIAKQMAIWGTFLSLSVLLVAVSLPGVIIALLPDSVYAQNLISIKTLMFWLGMWSLPFFTGIIIVSLSPFVALINDARHLSRVRVYP
jgi:uncharacterized membrane protein